MTYQDDFRRMATRALGRSDEAPFDASDTWLRAFHFGMDDDVRVPPPAPVDWAHRAARGIVEELRDDYGGALEQAFSRDLVGEDGRESIIQTMAAIIRQALAEAKPA